MNSKGSLGLWASKPLAKYSIGWHTKYRPHGRMRDNKHDECNVLALISHLHTSPIAETLGQSTLAYQSSWLGAFPCGLQWNSHREAQLIPVSDSARPRQPDLQPLSNPKSWKGEEKQCATERFESWRHSHLEKDLLIQSLFVNLFRQGWKTHFPCLFLSLFSIHVLLGRCVPAVSLRSHVTSVSPVSPLCVLWWEDRGGGRPSITYWRPS